MLGEGGELRRIVTPAQPRAYAPGARFDVPCIPPALRPALLRLQHDSPAAGHLGTHRTFGRLASRYWWEGMYRDAVEHVAACDACRRAKTPRLSGPLPVCTMRPPGAPFDIIGVDFLGPLPQSGDFRYVLVVMCHFSRYALCFPTIDRSPQTVAQIFLHSVFCIFGMPRVVLTDNGKEFDNRMLEQVFHLLDIEKRWTSP